MLGERLAITLRHLATGETQTSLALAFRIGRSTAGPIFDEVSSALYEVLKDDYMGFPNTSQWKEVASGFDIMWDYPHCCGAIDGKHIRIKCPNRSGSEFYNYKGFFR